MTARTRQHFVVLFVVLALVAAACSDDGGTETGTGETTTTTTTTTTAAPGDDPPEPPEEVAPFDSYRGVTADTITVGVLTTDLDELRELGLVDINQGDRELIWQTMIDDVNADGGIAGRQVEMVYREYNPVFTASADDACIELTQDNEVFIVLGGVAGPAIDSILCFVEQQEHMVIGGTHTPAHYPKATMPWVSTVMSSPRRHQGTLALYQELGLLDGRVATYDDSSEHETVTEDVVLPALSELGIDVVQSFTSNVPQGDEVALAEQASVYAEVIDDENIDTLIIIQSGIAFGIAHMRENGFTGTILAIDTGTQVNTIGGLDERPPSLYDGAYAPMGASRDESWELDASQACYDLLRNNAGIDVLHPDEVPEGDPDWVAGATAPCQYLSVLKAAGDFAGGDLNPTTFRAGLDQIGEIELANVVFASISAGKYDADDSLRIGQFDFTSGEIGKLEPVTDVDSVD
jgi:ABC-type branched-subunit amino acid transport system substrate-binding protein